MLFAVAKDAVSFIKPCLAFFIPPTVAAGLLDAKIVKLGWEPGSPAKWLTRHCEPILEVKFEEAVIIFELHNFVFSTNLPLHISALATASKTDKSLIFLVMIWPGHYTNGDI